MLVCPANRTQKVTEKECLQTNHATTITPQLALNACKHWNAYSDKFMAAKQLLELIYQAAVHTF
jgi:hypothetical protein